MSAATLQCLLCQVDASYLAIPISHVIEVTRPLGVTRLPDAPSWVAGVAVLRGIATPVIDARKLLAGAAESGEVRSPPPPASRWVSLRIDDRRVALAVDAVLRAHSLAPDMRHAVPPLLGSTRAITALGTLDQKLLMVLAGAQLLASEAFASMEGYADGA
ncbi:MAG TPA: chemotaxis protein CheW [Polyangiales bacterium]|jgi:purine-binding chemotaxis protein CheW|nr:chemotaxis protein CheW [Polyangiales bacterium]